MASLGIICAGGNSEGFTLDLCQASHDRHAQDDILFVGIHSSDSSTRTVDRLKRLGIRAATVEDRSVFESAEIRALTALFQAFNGINVGIPQFVLLILDEHFTTRPDLKAQSWQVVRTFRENYPSVEVIAIYFTRRERYTMELNQLRTLVSASGSHAILISQRAPLQGKFGRQYRTLLARQLAILLVAEKSSTMTVPFREQIQQVRVPFVGLALVESETPQLWREATAFRGRLSPKVVKDAAHSLTQSIVDLLNNDPTPQTSFDRISPEARINGNEMLAVNLFVPPMRDVDLEELDIKMERMLHACCVDSQGTGMAMVERPQSPAALSDLGVISFSSIPLVTRKTFTNVPVLKRLAVSSTNHKTSQILIVFGIEDPPA